ncbi:L-histidine N(alpha)-methyltransferase [uncultured Flavobacterium sp.]|uniref:L-histidine N(alpha)-methyltransferase n=1 Tax=uncultured Flavobacterium sp. TaxID=165435 RepID=UPI0030ED5857|tara:strand:+ start:2417 stop:3343 length:927 start_codon:yes stop_codon:yes gene_type:complete
MNQTFYKDVIEGLSKHLKTLPSKYFYDDAGDKIFQEIMQMEAYYLPQCELEILNNQTEKIVKSFGYDSFDIVGLGAGDGSKTKHFLKRITDLNKKVVYYPLDISADVLETNKQNITVHIPSIEMYPIAGDYFETLDKLVHDNPKIILFLGSTIGNYDTESAELFMKKIYDMMDERDILMVSFDLKKNPHKVLAAYNDEKGITKRFNLNLLKRINREINGNFDIEKFDHYANYDPISGTTYSYIFSKIEQTVTIENQKIHFKANELIHTEISQKYSLNTIETFKNNIDFKSVEHFLDDGKNYAISLFKK